MNPFRDRKLREKFLALPPEFIEENNRRQQEDTRKQYEIFSQALKINRCYLCKKGMFSFDIAKPCMHWFTIPPKLRKRDFDNYLNKPLSFKHLEAYLRWLGHSEKPFGNINDFSEDRSANIYKSVTIKFKNVEWSLSIGQNDKEGHPNAHLGSAPHYHIQIQIDGRPFIRFNDFHIPMTEYDLFMMAMEEQLHDHADKRAVYGMGMSALEDPEMLELLDEHMTITDDTENATFSRQSIITAGATGLIKGETLKAAMEESKRTKEPIGKIMQRLVPDVKVQTIISPGNGVPEKSKRKKRN